MHDWQCLLEYVAHSRRVSAGFAACDGWEDSSLAVIPAVSATAGRFHIDLCLRSYRPLTLARFHLAIPLPSWVGADTRIFVNGYQSWSRSQEFLPHQEQPVLSPLLGLLRPYGEPPLDYGAGPGFFHSWSFTYLRVKQHVWLVGSTRERSGFTLFETIWPMRRLHVEKECSGRRVEPGEEYHLTGLYAGQGSYPGEVFSGLAEACGLPEHSARRWTGWTSIARDGAAEIRRALRGLRDLNIPLDFIMIDDGYQSAVGDWLTTNSRFPDGMGQLALEIRDAGYRPALWLAPFIAENRSALWRRHPNWFLRDEGGGTLTAGFNDRWSGAFYALDLGRPEPRAHLTEIIRTVTAEWGFTLLKVDYAYAACLRSNPKATRGEAMAGALELIRTAAGDTPILACGVPLGPAWGLVDLCRIGADTAPYWHDRKLTTLGFSERVTAENAVTSMIGRSWLDKRFFLNDPDVFMLRRRACRLTPAQRQTLFLLCYLCGSVFSFSDPLESLGAAEKALLCRAFPAVDVRVMQHEPDGQFHLFWLDHRGDRFLAVANLHTRPGAWQVPPALAGVLLFDQLREELAGDGTCLPTLELGPYETRLLKLSIPGLTQVIGTSLHLLGGKADVAALELLQNGVRLRLVEGVRGPGKVWVALGRGDRERLSKSPMSEHGACSIVELLVDGAEAQVAAGREE